MHELIVCAHTSFVMAAALVSPQSGVSSECPAGAIEPTSALQFMRVVGQLKTLKRTGWVNHGVELPESVADHMYRMSVMAMLLTDSSLNKDRLVKSKSLFDC